VKIRNGIHSLFSVSVRLIFPAFVAAVITDLTDTAAEETVKK
jgi:hypothetical protein